jgi:hypothetical protein
VVCKNPLLAEERARKREDLLQATEAAFSKLAEQFARSTGPKGHDKIARAVGCIENRYKLAKLFDIAVAEDGSALPATPPASPTKRGSMVSMSSAPVSRTKPWPPTMWSAPIRVSPASSAPSAA